MVESYLSSLSASRHHSAAACYSWTHPVCTACPWLQRDRCTPTQEFRHRSDSTRPVTAQNSQCKHYRLAVQSRIFDCDHPPFDPFRGGFQPNPMLKFTAHHNPPSRRPSIRARPSASGGLPVNGCGQVICNCTTFDTCYRYNAPY
jgi:hypothetical protein